MRIRSRIVRFGLTGVFVTAIHMIVVILLVEAGLAGPVPANGMAFILATITSFLINAGFTFSTAPTMARFARFLAVTLVCGMLSVTIASIAERAGIDYRLGVLLVISIVPAASFILHSQWTFPRQ